MITIPQSTERLSVNVGMNEGLPTRPVKIDHQGRFVQAMGLALVFTEAAHFYLPAIGGAVVCYVAGLVEARKVPELNSPQTP